jgi:hypothetical protein
MAEYSDKKYNRSLKNPTIEGSDGLVLPTGTTSGGTGRPVSPTVGSIRYNSTTGLAEVYSSIGYVSVDSPPTISTFSGLINESQNTTITVTGLNFQVGAVISVSGAATSNVSRNLSTTRINGTTLTATTAAASSNYVGGQNFNITVTNPSGLSNTLSTAGTVDGAPVWSTSAGSLGTVVIGDAASFSPSATDPNADTITYSVASGSLPTGTSINSSTGAITGTVSGSDGTFSFTLRARSTQASTVSTSDRSFSIIVTAVATGGTISDITLSGTNYKLHAFTSGTSNFVLNTNKAIDVLIVGGGGGGGRAIGDNDTGKGGAGAGQALVRTGYSPGAGTYSIVVGAGGPGQTNGTGSAPAAPTSAGNSTGFGVTANGGGYGGASDNHYGPQTGGSGGGAGARNGNSNDNGAASNKTSPAGWTSYGNAGGNSGSGNFGGGGGGGAGGTGSNQSGPAQAGTGGNGGIGIDLGTTFGTGYGSPGGWFAGGGGGGSYTTGGSLLAQSNTNAGGYYGGGGRGTSCVETSSGNQSNVTNNDAVANTGGGGGGAAEDANQTPNKGSRSGAGAAGIVLIRYQV